MQRMSKNFVEIKAAVFKVGTVILAFSLLLTSFAFAAVRAQEPAVQTKRFKPELVVQTGHSGKISSMAYSPNGKLIASGGWDQTVRLWEVETGNEVRVFSGLKTNVGALAFSPDGKVLAAEAYFSLKLWDVATGQELTPPIAQNWNVSSVVFSRDGQMVAAGSNDQTTRVWDVKSGKELWKFGDVKGYTVEPNGVGHIPEEAVKAVAFSPTENILASASSDGKIRLFNITNGTLSRTLAGHTSPISSILYSSDGKRLVSASETGIRIWNADNGDLISDPGSNAIYDSAKSITSIALSPDGDTLCVLDGNGGLTLYSLDGKRKPKSLQSKSGGTFDLVAFGTDGETFATAGSGIFGNAEIRLWDKAEGKELRTLTGNANKIYAMGLSPDGSKLAVADDYSTINIWNASRNDPLKSVNTESGHDVKTIASGSTGFSSIAFSPDSQSLAVGSIGGTEIFDSDTGTLRVKLEKAKVDYAGHPLAFTPDGKSIAVAGPDDFSLWDLQSASIVRTFGRYSLENWLTRPMSIAVDQSGKYLAGGSTDGVTRLWDLNSGNEIRTLCVQKEPITSVAFSPDGKFLATSAKLGNYTVCDVKTGNPILGFEEGAGSLNVEQVAFSPDSAKIAAVDIFGKIRIWDLKTSKLESTFAGQADSGAKQSIAFSPNGKVLFSISGRAKIDAWSLADNRKSASLVTIGKSDWAVVTPDGYFNASDGAQSLMHFVLIDPQNGYETISLRQVGSKHWDTDLLQKVFKGESLPSADNFSITLSPDIQVEQAKPDSPLLKVDLKNRGGGIGRVEVRVNGGEFTPDASAGQPIDRRAAAASLKINIPKDRLRSGDNEIDIITWNLEGDVQSLRYPAFLNLADNGLVSKGGVLTGNKTNKPPSEIDYYAIVSGISNYSGPINLRFSAKDAEDMARALTLAARRYFCADEMAAGKPCLRVHVRLLSTETDEKVRFNGKQYVPDFQRLDPVKNSYETVFADVAAKANADDVVTVYFSGHATTINTEEAVRESAIADTYLYATRDATTLDTSALRNETERAAKTVSSLELAKWLSDIKADKKVLVLDTCAAGAAQKDLSEARDSDPLQTRSIERLRTRTGFFVLMGSAGNAQSFEANQYRQGLLTYSLLEGMTVGGKLAPGGFVDVDILLSSAKNRVEDLAKGLGNIQVPMYWRPGLSESFDIGRIEDEERKLIPIASPVPIIQRPFLFEKVENSNVINDAEGLTEKLKAALLEQSLVSQRGAGAAINYVDATNGGGITPNGSYTVNGDRIKIVVTLIKNNKPFAEVTASGTRENVIENLVQEMLKTLSAAQIATRGYYESN